MYIKYEDTPIGELNSDGSVNFYNNINTPLDFIHPNEAWSGGRFKEFLSDRIVSRGRRDIEFILRKLKLNTYDELAIAKKTRAFSLSDKLWLSESREEGYNETFLKIFVGLYGNLKSEVGDSVSSPSGNNKKYYAFLSNDFGIVKERLHPSSTDIENEVICYRLSKLFGVNCCEARMVDKDRVFSKYEYDFNKEIVVHARRYLENQPDNIDDYTFWTKHVFPDLKSDIQKMILFDFITLQDDRHKSNWAIKIDSNRNRSFYSLYDNGRSLLSDYTEEMATRLVQNPANYVTSFGYVGTYLDVVDVIKSESSVESLISLGITELPDEIFKGLGIPAWKEQAIRAYIKWAVGYVFD